MRVDIKSQSKNEDGYAMLMTMMMLVLLTVIGIAATHTSNIEVQIAGNGKASMECFYDTEGLLVDTLEDSRNWLTVGLMTSSTASAHLIMNGDADGDTVDDSLVEVRCIENTGSTIAALTPFADGVPTDRHITAPPAGKYASSMVSFEVRRYAVSVTNNNCNTNVQSGVWKVLNKPSGR